MHTWSTVNMEVTNVYCMTILTKVKRGRCNRTPHRQFTPRHSGGTVPLRCSKFSQCHRGLGQTALGSPRHRHDRRGTAMTAVAMTAIAPPLAPCLRSTNAVNSRKSRLATLRRSRGGSTAIHGCVTGRGEL